MVKKPADKKATAFSTALRGVLHETGVRQVDLSSSLEVSGAYISSLYNGSKIASASTVEKIADALPITEVQRVKLHRAAAVDNGFRLDLPDDFDD